MTHPEPCKHCGHSERQHEYSYPKLCDAVTLSEVMADKTRKKQLCPCPGYEPTPAASD